MRRGVNMKEKMTSPLVRLASLLVLTLMLVSMTVYAGGLQTHNDTYQPYSDTRPPLLFNVTAPTSMLGQDPAFYSFEAYHFNASGTPVKVVIGEDLLFNDSGLTPVDRTVDIPTGNYSAEVLNVSISEFNGTQFDRQVYIFADGVPIFWGSTQEIHNSTAESVVTEFEDLLRGNVTFQMVIENFYDAKVNITGLYEMNVTLYLYPGQPPKGLPNEFIPLFTSYYPYNYSYVIVNPGMDTASSNVTIPNGTYKMQALLYEEGGGLDEFWYANEPATREVLLYYNGHLAGDLNPFETIYTGGINLFYWKPLTSVDTLSYHSPYVVDLTPMLAMGHNATVTVKVTNLRQAFEVTGSTAFDWDLSGVLMLWVNQSNPMTGGEVVTEEAEYMDSSPIFLPGYLSSVYYQEAGHYVINYTSILHFEKGVELAETTQEGKFVAKQTFNQVYEDAYLDESFSELVRDTGMYNYTLAISGDYPVTLCSDSVAEPITPTTVIPYNLSYAQNGSLTLSMRFEEESVFNGYNVSCYVSEGVRSVGGFSGIVEVINNYGGSELVSLTSNNALTYKSLNFTFTEDGVGFHESFSGEGIQNNTVNTSGYYRHVMESISPLPDPVYSPGMHEYVTQGVMEFFRLRIFHF